MGNRSEMEKLEISELKSIYSGKKVFLTGHTGYKGAWFTLMLHRLGAEVKGFSLAPKSHTDLYPCIGGDSFCQSVIGDIRQREVLKKELLDFQPDFVFHLAAQALVLDSYQIPVETFETNVMGTIHVLDALRELPKRCDVVIITTDKVYENLERAEPYAEHERLGGHDPYSNSKACAELATASYRLSFFHPEKFDAHQKNIATARSGNVIGGGDRSANRIVPDLVRALENGEELIVRNPRSVRPWQHVLDPLFGYLTLGARMHQFGAKYSDGFNFGPQSDDMLTVEELVKVAIQAWGSGTYRVQQNPNQPHEANLLMLAIKKAKMLLGWEPFYTSEEAIYQTIDWYKHAGKSPLEYTLKQIDSFFAEQ